MTNYLITGGAGFIGTNFVRFLRAKKARDRVVVLDALTYAGNRANLDGVPDIMFVLGDIRDFDLVKQLLVDLQIDTLVHFAAETHVDRSISAPDIFIESNIVGTHTLLKAAKAVWLDTVGGKPHRFHHVSTDEVFGSLEPDEPPCSETARYRPNSPYAASKAAADHLVRAYHRTFGLQTTISYCTNNYGPHQFREKFIPLLLTNALQGKSMPIYGDGMNLRDWLYVEDHCRAIMLVLALGRAGEAYNIASGMALSNNVVAAALCKAIDAAFQTDGRLAERFPHAAPALGRPTSTLTAFVSDRPGHDRRYSIDTTKIAAELGFKPKCTFAAGLAATLDWYLANEVWWHAVAGQR